VALVLYSIGVGGAFRRKGATRSQLVLLWVGVAFDVLATLMMAIQPTSSVATNLAANPSFYIVTAGMGTTTLVLINDLKTYLALLGMAGMVVGAAFATAAFRKHDAKAALSVSRWIVAPWALWVAVFVYGIATRMPRR
jgi:hypothetical protein